jgi:hypothetical protein
LIFDFRFAIAAGHRSVFQAKEAERHKIKSEIKNQKPAMASLGSFAGAFARAQRTAGVTLTQLSASSACQLRLFVGADTSAGVYRQHSFNFGVGAGDNMHADQLADSTRSRGARVGGGFHCAHVATHKDRHVPGADVLFSE